MKSIIILTTFLLTALVTYGQAPEDEIFLASNNSAGLARVPDSESSSSLNYEKLSKVKQFVNKNISHISSRSVYISCNDDSSYYKSDTVRIRQLAKNFYPETGCCQFVEWRMVTNSKFIWSDLSNCDKTDRSYYLSPTVVHVIENNNQIYLKIMRNGLLVEMFKVIGLDEQPYEHISTNSKVLVLARVDEPIDV
ncbi:hypothetical protein [Fulvivirga ligni]|uniref:hypothetical protein n=1 Tax=Fulvivirga ligni TaxID=2904246 RepID=UPI001F1A719A|nr:hypothetical protein [Fulvivirga ligni]UII23974.1 hypothetical protein LVD16_12170 [Fulvivirga ligni]